MTKPNKVKKPETGAEESEKVTEAIAGKAEAKSPPTTNEDLMFAISSLNKTVDKDWVNWLLHSLICRRH